MNTIMNTNNKTFYKDLVFDYYFRLCMQERQDLDNLELVYKNTKKIPTDIYKYVLKSFLSFDTDEKIIKIAKEIVEQIKDIDRYVNLYNLSEKNRQYMIKNLHERYSIE